MTTRPWARSSTERQPTPLAAQVTVAETTYVPVRGAIMLLGFTSQCMSEGSYVSRYVPRSVRVVSGTDAGSVLRTWAVSGVAGTCTSFEESRPSIWSALSLPTLVVLLTLNGAWPLP